MRLGAKRGNAESPLLHREAHQAGLAFVRELVEAGKVKPIVERRYELHETAEAIEYIGQGHARAKVVVAM